jgi:VIT1/CCC1 family predicted Fe2+/Mn2+ transporter
VGADLPGLVAAVMLRGALIPFVAGTSLLFLALSGATPWSGALRVVFWGALAMAVTSGMGALFGTAP